jgi:hypothetical protein
MASAWTYCEKEEISSWISGKKTASNFLMVSLGHLGGELSLGI